MSLSPKTKQTLRGRLVYKFKIIIDLRVFFMRKNTVTNYES